MRSATFTRALLTAAALLFLFAVQFVAADNWGFRSFASDTGAWRYSCYVSLPAPAYNALHHPVGAVLLQPSLFVITRAWHPLFSDGRPLRSPFAIALMRLSEDHHLAFLALVAAVNTFAWAVFGLLSLRAVQLFRSLRTRRFSRPA